MRAGDLVSISDFPAVVVLGDVAALKERLDAEPTPSADTEAQLRAYLEHYFIDEPGNCAACDDILGSLARVDGPGGAFIVRGVYGSGKSHLLAVISLLAERPEVWPLFLAGHPGFRQVARCFSPGRRLAVVQIALDEFRGQDQALEDVVFDAAQRELGRSRYGLKIPLSAPSHAVEVARQFLLPGHRERLDELASASGASWSDLAEGDPALAARLAAQLCEEREIPVVFRRSRAEALGLLMQRMKDDGLAGLVILLDELSLFLGPKSKRDLDADASFLQFLAQRSARQPIWVAASLQRALEDLGDIDAHTLRQIGDRFASHSLSLAQLRIVLDRKVVQKKPQEYRPAIEGVYSSLAEAGPVCFSKEELARLYPLNPLALECLEALSESFLSKTRSLIQFVQGQWPGLRDEDCTRLLCCEDVFDFFWPKMERLPESRPYAAAFSFLEQHVRRMGLEDVRLAAALTKGLLLSGMAGLRWTVREHADALAGSRSWKGARPNYPQVREALDALHRRGAYVEVSRQAEEFADIYFLDVTTDASEIVRRRLDEILASLEPEDGRVVQCALSACSGEAFPLAGFTGVRVVPVEHLNLRRPVSVSIADLRLIQQAELVNSAARLENPQEEDDACLFIATPFGVQQQRDAWLQASAGIQGRFAAGLVAWLPRAPTEHEAAILREYAALRLMLDDPALRQSRKGLATQEAAAGRVRSLEHELRALLMRLYGEGEILGSSPAAARPVPPLAEGWDSTLSSILRPAFEALFPGAGSVAPGRLLSGRLHVNQVISQFLRPRSPVVLPGSALEAHLRDFLAPLGLVEKKDGKWTVSCSQAPAVDAVISLIPQEGSISFADLAGALRKSPLGLTGEQSELALASMARAGWITPLDAFLTPVKFEEMGLPLPDHAPFWIRTRLMPAEKEQAALDLAASLFDWQIERLDPPAQQQLWDRARSWAEGAAKSLPRCRQELDSLLQALGHERIQWAETSRLLGQAGSVLSRLRPDDPAAEGLESLLESVNQLENGASDLRRFDSFQRFARDCAAEIERIHRYAADERLLTLPGSLLERQRERLMDAFKQGEEMVGNADQLLKAGRDFVRSYRKEYVAWHAQAHSPAHFRPYLEAKDAAWHAALGALAKAGLDSSAVLEAVDLLLRQALEKHCAGGRLPAALDESPVCPQCGIALGQRPELPPLGEIEKRAKVGMRSALSALKAGDVRERVEARLPEAPDQARDGVRRLLALGDDASPTDVLSCCTAEVAEWLRMHLAQAAATRSIQALVEAIKGKRLSKQELVRLVTQWLDAQGTLGDDDYVDVS